MKMEYVNVNGYLIPKLENGPITDNTIGKYGMMRARYLDEHRPMERDQMLLDGTLAQHLTNIDCEAHRQVESLTKVLAAEAKINEEMKRCNPLEWAAAMQGLQAQAEEIVCAELIYAEENTNDSLSTKTNAFCLGIILCNVSRSFDYLIYPYYPAYTS